ncbi:MAG: ATP synthase F1 subunit epsilon [Fermentimonas sp.]|jgi:F-type H+-transporting ATPase subunit epsilon
MQLQILTPEETFYSGEAESVTLPGYMGSFQILRNHAPLIASLQNGYLSFLVDGNIKTIEIADGFVEVKDNMVTVLVDSIRK